MPVELLVSDEAGRLPLFFLMNHYLKQVFNTYIAGTSMTTITFTASHPGVDYVEVASRSCNARLMSRP